MLRFLLFSVCTAATLTTTVTELVLSCPTALTAVATLVSAGNSTVTGVVEFVQYLDNTTVSYNISGNDPNSQRGFHIHTYGDLTDGCASTGSHYNPFNVTHGGPFDQVRHVGDLEMITADEHGNAVGSYVDPVVKLSGPFSILGRAVVVHSGVDDYGHGNQSDSKTTGHAGGRKACGIIGWKAPPS